MIDERGLGRTATERFDAQCTRSGKKIEHARTDDPIAQARKDRRFHPIHRRTNIILRNLKPDAASGSGDYSHGQGVGVATG